MADCDFESASKAAQAIAKSAAAIELDVVSEERCRERTAQAFNLHSGLDVVRNTAEVLDFGSLSDRSANH